MKKLNPIIRGQANYNRRVVASQAFHRLDQWLYKRQRRYVDQTHPRKSEQWKQNKYWGRLNLDRHDYCVFGNKNTGRYLLKYSWFPIERHVLVKGTASPDDPKLHKYWEQREATKAKDLPPSSQKIVKGQNGRCPICGESLFNGEELHLHHKVPKSRGGRNSYANLVFLHLYCHQKLHSHDKSKIVNNLSPA